MHLATTVLTGLGLVALALSAPADIGDSHSTIGPTTYWENTQTQKYHCEGKDVIRCETTVAGTCLTIDICEAYCFNHDNGAACVDMGEPIVNTSNGIDTSVSKASTSMLGVNLAARDASPQENKHYTCSQDLTGVLICKYGFCSTDHYCKSGEECKDDSVSCKSKSTLAQGTKSEVRVVPMQFGDTTIRLAARGRDSKPNNISYCSEDRSSVFKCIHSACATDYYCAKGHPCIDNPARCKKAFSS